MDASKAAKSLAKFFDGAVVEEIEEIPLKCWCGADATHFDAQGQGFCHFHWENWE